MNLFLNFVSYPTSAEQLNNKIEYDDKTDIQLLIKQRVVNWTVSPKAKEGDLILFYHTQSAFERIEKVEKDAKKNEELYSKLKSHIDLSYEYFEKYGSSIFAIGIVCDSPEEDKDAFDFETHFKERCFADISDIKILKFPIKIDDIKDYVNLNNFNSKEEIDKDTANKLISLIVEREDLSFELKNQIDLFLRG